MAESVVSALAGGAGVVAAADSGSAANRYFRGASMDQPYAFFGAQRASGQFAAGARIKRFQRTECAHLRVLRRSAGQLVLFAGCIQADPDAGGAPVLHAAV